MKRIIYQKITMACAAIHRHTSSIPMLALATKNNDNGNGMKDEKEWNGMERKIKYNVQS